MKLDEKGFIFIETIFIAMVVSFTAILIFNGLEVAIKSNRTSAIRTQAIRLANSQIAIVENYVDQNKIFPSNSYTLLTADDLQYKNYFGINGTIKFNIDTEIKNPIVTVKVTWSLDDKDYGTQNENNYEELSKEIYITP